MRLSVAAVAAGKGSDGCWRRLWPRGKAAVAAGGCMVLKPETRKAAAFARASPRSSAIAISRLGAWSCEEGAVRAEAAGEGGAGLGFRRDNAVAVKAQLNDDVGGSANNSASSGTKADSSALKGKNVRNENVSPPSAPLTEEAIAEFMTQVASLVELVDSRDIVELQLKQNDCEVIIRKKEALPQPPPSQVVMMQTPASPLPVSQAIPQPSPAPALPSPASPAPPASAPASTPKALKTSHPPLKSPMSGTLYRSPGPGLPPFVKPGDKVSKGQVLCIIEAMKLMNEIESDQAGTVVEILIEDGKPVGVGQRDWIAGKGVFRLEKLPLEEIEALAGATTCCRRRGLVGVRWTAAVAQKEKPFCRLVLRFQKKKKTPLLSWAAAEKGREEDL
ncbi:hypothetical protein ZIOFF_027186 [Zingiber officinale]|uniref:Lipoyl-binding domain-containing protein n=1 Tax=Zingiber officinale TaxID=94328 RepID=A0A8J5GXE3_ZINOF|nr:hypothetical protein ZIOFF_027186 [Zingiber officinale]